MAAAAELLRWKQILKDPPPLFTDCAFLNANLFFLFNLPQPSRLIKSFLGRFICVVKEGHLPFPSFFKCPKRGLHVCKISHIQDQTSCAKKRGKVFAAPFLLGSI